MSTITILAALSLLGGFAAPSGAYERPATFERVDVTADGRPVDSIVTSGHLSSISADGRFVAFETEFALSEVDKNEMFDVYLRDLRTGKTELISVAPDGMMAVGPPNEDPQAARSLSGDPAISSNGRYVAFSSKAVNLVAGDTNGSQDIFVYDRTTGKIERASLTFRNEQSQFGESFGPSISTTGRVVSFTSRASDLVEGDTNEGPDIFVRDRGDDTTVRASVDSKGNQVETCGRLHPDVYLNPSCLILGGEVAYSSISGNGRHVAFDSRAPNLVEDDTNLQWDVFVHDLRSKKTERVSVSSDGSEAATYLSPPGNSFGGSLLSGFTSDPAARAVSADGRFVAFTSLATNLVPNDRNLKPARNTGGQDVFVHDRQTGRTERISVDAYGQEQNAAVDSASGSDKPSISGNGRYVAFYCGCYPLDDEKFADSTVYDRGSGANSWLTYWRSDEPGEGPTRSNHPEISYSGRYVTSNEWGPYWRGDMGERLGVGGLGNTSNNGEETPEYLICVTAVGVCLPPGAAVSSSDATGDLDEALTKQGVNLYSASVAYRPRYSDLFVKIELKHMPKVSPGLSPIFYGLRFEAEQKSYEVRATSLNYGTFGLFDCTDSPTCTKVADLRGGYGTTGMRVVFSLPLDEIGLEDGGKLRDVEAFSGLGSYLTGATKVLDRVRIR